MVGYSDWFQGLVGYSDWLQGLVGYSVDLLMELASAGNFDYEIIIPPDNLYGEKYFNLFIYCHTFSLYIWII